MTESRLTGLFARPLEPLFGDVDKEPSHFSCGLIGIRMKALEKEFEERRADPNVLNLGTCLRRLHERRADRETAL